MATAVKPPTSDENVVGSWTGSVGLRYTLVDDYPDTVPADVLDTPTATGGAQITFGFSPFSIPAGSTGISVQVLYYDRDVTSGTNNAGGRLKVGGTYYNATTHNPSTTLTVRSDNWATNPKTATAWTVDDINGVGVNALQAFGFNSTDASPAVRFSCVQLQVTYTPPSFSLTVDNAAHAQSADNITLTAYIPTFMLAIQDAGQGQATDSLTLTPHAPNFTLAIANAGHTQAADATSLTQHGLLSVSGSAQAQSADALSLTGHVPIFTLTIQNAAQLQQADTATLLAHDPIAGVVLSIQDVAQNQSAEATTLTQHCVLGIDLSEQFQAADSATLTAHGVPEGPVFELDIQNSGQVQGAESLMLTQHHFLGTADAAHLQYVDEMDFLVHVPGRSLIVQNAVQLCGSDEFAVEGQGPHGRGPAKKLTGQYNEWDFMESGNWW